MPRRIETLFERYRRRGDAGALGVVFDRTANEILKVAMHLAPHAAAAEDLVQETFLTAIDRAESWDGRRPLVPWLLGILRNHARTARRLEDRARRSRSAQAASAHDEPWRGLAGREDVLVAVRRLCAPYREVLVLLLEQDRPPAEIALLLDRAPGTVRSQIHRGLERLRDRLPDDVRSHVPALLPLGAGLAHVREHVLAHATVTAAGSTTASGTLLLVGGLAMSKKVLVGGWLLVVLLTVGGALAFLPRLDPTPRDEAGEPAQRDSGAAAPPVLVGRAPPSPEAASTARSRAEKEVATKVTAWPPDDPVPPDKGSVAGIVTFEDGTPLVGARVALWGSSSIVAITDERGRYHIHGEWVHDRALFLRLGAEGGPDWLGLILSHDIPMVRGALVRQDVVLERGIDIEGVVVDDRTGGPLPEVKVTLRRTDTMKGQGVAGFVFTDAAGHFAFPYVPRRKVSVQLERDGHQPVLRTVDLAEEPFPGRWALRAGPAWVLRFSGLPARAVGTKVRLMLQLVAPAPGVHASWDAERKIRPDGTVLLDAPEPGRYHLTIFRSSHLPRIEQQVTVGEPPLDPVIVGLRPGAEVRGTIRDARGRPLADVRLDIEEAAGRPTSDADGAFVFSWVPAGERGVEVRVEGAWIRVGTVAVPASGTVQVDLRSAGRSSVRGQMKIGGRPARARTCELQLRDLAEDVVRATVRPGGDGRFQIPMLPGGRYQAFVWSAAAQPRAWELHLGAREDLDLGGIELEPWLSVPVHLDLPPDRPDGAEVQVSAWDPEEPHVPLWIEIGGRKWGLSLRLDTDEDGTTWVRGLPPGRVRLRFGAEGLEARRLDVDARPGMTVPIAVRLRAR